MLQSIHSDVTAILENVYHANIESLQNCPTLPVTGKFIKSATGSRSTRLKLQIMIPTCSQKIRVNPIYRAVPKLIKNCILRIDAHEKSNMIIHVRGNFFDNFGRKYY